jgi:type 1 glutamine amidotransferase
MRRRLFAFLLALAPLVSAEPRRILYVTATYGFRHSDSIDASVEVFQQIAQESGGRLAIDHTEDIGLLTAANLRNYDAVYFFTSGEMPLTDQQKADLLDFVRSGKGFGGSHSATDCNYTWPEYGDLIGGYFDGHPWAQEAAVDVEDTASPLVSGAAPSFRFTEEFYQFRNFSRDRVRVLVTLDTRSVDMTAPGINRTDGDFALAWIRSYGQGRVFYSAFGHFAESFQLPPVRTMLSNALLWLTGQLDADATPRPAAPPSVASVNNLAGGADAFAPGDLMVVEGDRLTSGSSWTATAVPLPVKLAGTHVEVNGRSALLFSVAPARLLLQLPPDLVPGDPAALTVSSATLAGPVTPLKIVAADPAILAAARIDGALVLYATGLANAQPTVLIRGAPAPVFFAGLALGFVGLYQINVLLPADAGASFDVVVEAGGRQSNVFRWNNPDAR